MGIGPSNIEESYELGPRAPCGSGVLSCGHAPPTLFRIMKTQIKPPHLKPVTISVS